MTPLGECALVLASGSRYRRELLERMGVRFRCINPDIDERTRTGERVQDLVVRLACEKARAVTATASGALVLGSDQAAELDGHVLGKPGSAEVARSQLAECSGRIVAFHTAVCLVDARTSAPTEHVESDITRVAFRSLESAEIARYVEREKPFDCAGSFRCEGLGIALFERIETNDPTALIGLPLTIVTRLLHRAGIRVI